MVTLSGPRRKFLTIGPDDNVSVIKGLSSPVRLRILHLLRRRGPANVNEISAHLGLPQSTIATNVQVLEAAGLIRTELLKAAKGQQKVCSARYDEIVIRLDGAPAKRQDNVIEVAMPLGLYTTYQVTRTLRPVLDRRHHRPAGRPRPFPRSQPDAGLAGLVRPRPCRVQVPEQCQDR